jgi:predicted amidohydrolase YtcJ
MNRIGKITPKTRTVQAGSAPAAIVLGLIALAGSAPTGRADLLIMNARIITMNDRQPEASAVAIRGDRIEWVGASDDANKTYGDAAQKLDLGGATVLPGINDAHGHLQSLGGSFIRLNLKGAATPQEAVKAVKEKAGKTGAGQWIQGWGWDEGKWASSYPTNEGLNEASPNNPVFLVGLHGFASWANKKALEMCGITRETRDPAKGTILRDPVTGEATGILLNSAQDLVAVRIPPLSLSQIEEAIELAARECARNGLTSVQDARVTPIMIQAIRELVKQHRLPVRVYAMLDGADSQLVDEWLSRGPEIDNSGHRFTVRCFKLFADGALGSRGASLLQPYKDDPGNKGVMTTSGFAVYTLTRRAMDRGFQVAVHAIGDAANREVLDAFEKALGDGRPAADPRLRVEHAQVVAARDMPRFAKLGVLASMQPVHCTSDMDWAEKRLGPERIRGAYAWRSLLKSGAHLPLSSDFPGETLNPFYGIYAAITRQHPDGNPPGGWHAEQKLTLDEALRGYTLEAAYAEFEENQKGSIEKGKLADLIVISKDITRSSPKDILSIQVLKTFVGGKLVYEK